MSRGRSGQKVPVVCRNPESSTGSQMNPVDSLNSDMYPRTVTKHVLSLRKSLRLHVSSAAYEEGLTVHPLLHMSPEGLFHRPLPSCHKMEHPL